MTTRLSISALLAGAAFASPALAQTQPAASTTQSSPSLTAQPAPNATTASAPVANGAQPTTTQGAAPASTATGAPPEPTPDTEDETDEDQPIVVTANRLHGAVVGDIPPENTLDARDVRATGATSINELLDALGPQIGSVRGRGGEQPIFLLNGQRISSFRELRDIPTEAIERVDILPEEVALKYGYSANQKVVNFVLRQRFRSTTAQLAASTATEGGYISGTGDVTRLLIQKNGRTTINLHAQGNGMLRESERDISLQELPDATNGATPEQELAARSLLGTKRDLRAGTTFNRQVLGDVSATLNTELEHTDGRSLIGLSDDTLYEALNRRTTTDTGHAGVALNWDKWDWRWSVTGNADLAHNTTRTDADPATDRAHETTSSGDFMATAHGNLFKLPGGDASTTLRIGGSASHLNSASTSDPIATSLGRTTGTAAINIDVPISRRGHDFSALGNLTLNANAEIQQLSDFGTLTTIGAGANFSPVDRLNFIASWTREEGAPTIEQLGDPVLTTPNTRIFDFTTGQTVLATSITGGNPDLKSDRRNVYKFSTNWQPFENTDLRLRADFVHQTIQRPISDITVTQQIEAAFPDRFTYGPVCDEDGANCTTQLTEVDLRPVNFDRSQRDSLRIGFDFSHPLKSHQPSQAVQDELRAQMRAMFGGAGRPGASGATAPPPAPGTAAPATTTTTPGASQPANAATPPAGTTPGAGTPATDAGGRPAGASGGRGGFGGGRGGRGGGFFGGRGGGSRGRLQFDLTDTITFVDKVSIAPGLPELDYLHGGAAGQSGGTPRHSVEAQAGYFNNGLGARIAANWRSGTTVTSETGDNLRFSPLATFNLTLFANPGDIPELVVKHPWLRGTQVRFEATNVFNTRPNVHDASGGVPYSYQPDLLDPLGRTVMISIRKLFLPSPSFFRRAFEQRQQQGTTSR